MPKIFYDIIPPKVIEGMKYEKKLAEIKKLDKPRPRFVIWRNFILKITVILLIVGLNWTGLSVVIETLGFLNDTEDSAQNIFAASTLDFSLDSPPDFSPIHPVDILLNSFYAGFLRIGRRFLMSLLYAPSILLFCCKIIRCQFL